MGLLSPDHEVCLLIRGGVLEEPSTAAKGENHGDPEVRGRPVAGVSDRPCTLVFLFSKTAVEEPFASPGRTSEGA